MCGISKVVHATLTTVEKMRMQDAMIRFAAAYLEDVESTCVSHTPIVKRLVKENVWFVIQSQHTLTLGGAQVQSAKKEVKLKRNSFVDALFSLFVSVLFLSSLHVPEKE